MGYSDFLTGTILPVTVLILYQNSMKMNTNQQNLECNRTDENNFERKMEELRNRLQSIEWDMRQGSFSKDKIPYYKKLLQEYGEMEEKFGRFQDEKQNG